MTVFNTFFKVIKKYKGTVILYTAFLVVFGFMYTKINNDTNNFFSEELPSIAIVNDDTYEGLTKNLIDYMSKNTKVIDIDSDKLDDALFYRDISYIIYIPKKYKDEVLYSNPEIIIKSTKDYNASLSGMMLKRYLEVQNIYKKLYSDENKVIESINSSLDNETEVSVLTNTSNNDKLTRYFNFASYSITAVIIYIICLVLSSFNDINVKKRTIVSSLSYKKYNRSILLASFTYGIFIWILYMLLGLILLGNLFTIQGLIYALNTLLFTLVMITLALLISTLTNNKNAISGIVNVVALAQAFLCGAFIPTKFLPTSVLSIARVLPAYWYINTNDLISSMQVFDKVTLKPVITNFCVLVFYIVLFVVVNNIVSKRKEAIN